MPPSKEQTDLELAHKRGEITLDELIEQSAARGLPVARRLQQSHQQTNFELALIRGEISRAELEAQSSALGLPVADYLLEPAQSKQYQPITITAEQLAARDKWEGMLMVGKITLDEALAMQMGIGVPIGDHTRQMYEQATSDYLAGEFPDLATPFGFAASSLEKKAFMRRQRVKTIVDHFNDRGYPNTNPSAKGKFFYQAGKDKDTAFHKAGKTLNRAATTVFDEYYDKPKRKRVIKKN